MKIITVLLCVYAPSIAGFVTRRNRMISCRILQSDLSLNKIDDVDYIIRAFEVNMDSVFNNSVSQGMIF